jgi:hypothetical protein
VANGKELPTFRSKLDPLFRVRQFNKPSRSKDEGTTSSETLVESYQSTRRNIAEDLSPHLNLCSLLLTI